MSINEAGLAGLAMFEASGDLDDILIDALSEASDIGC